MKKIIIIFVLATSLIVLINPKTETKKEEEIKGIFISYIELNKYVNKNEKESKQNIIKMLNNIENLKLNTIFLQVIISSDAIYHSKIYPTSMYIVKEEGMSSYDVLDYFLKKSHEKNIKVYAWINPYRVRTTEDTTTITKTNPAYQYLNTDYIYINDGIYYNPAKEEVTNLIIEGAKEILTYPIDGLIMDDYFYPNDDIDEKDYQDYLKNNEEITKQEFHLQVINNMVEKVHEECQKHNILFGISPEGNIENNYQKNYADVRLWMKEDNYIDFIMPQIYYGFYNSTKGYYKVIKEWESLLKNNRIKLLVALAFYKVGKEDPYAKEGREEWLQNSNIIMREILLSRNIKNYKGFSLFRYDSIFDRDNYTQMTIPEIENMKKIMK